MCDIYHSLFVLANFPNLSFGILLRRIFSILVVHPLCSFSPLRRYKKCCWSWIWLEFYEMWNCSSANDAQEYSVVEIWYTISCSTSVLSVYMWLGLVCVHLGDLSVYHIEYKWYNNFIIYTAITGHLGAQAPCLSITRLNLDLSWCNRYIN